MDIYTFFLDGVVPLFGLVALGLIPLRIVLHFFIGSIYEAQL